MTAEVCASALDLLRLCHSHHHGNMFAHNSCNACMGAGSCVKIFQERCNGMLTCCAMQASSGTAPESSSRRPGTAPGALSESAEAEPLERRTASTSAIAASPFVGASDAGARNGSSAERTGSPSHGETRLTASLQGYPDTASTPATPASPFMGASDAGAGKGASRKRSGSPLRGETSLTASCKGYPHTASASALPFVGASDAGAGNGASAESTGSPSHGESCMHYLLRTACS